MKVHLKAYFMKILNALFTSCFLWFQEHIAPPTLELSLKVVCYGILNCFTKLKRLLQNEKFHAFEGFLENEPQRV